ncbi:PepSY domain-containing protein [Shewanella xiamenensis]|uniref:PepSY domain-containing protein n=1 Tax=Shewanella xiamenensis TaxID=332186 RepID=UPI000849AEEA|nr:PepSY domain-containing protein [Shewanella xiamenensis]ODR85681.1 peptidase [Shewanella xiamenensis]
MNFSNKRNAESKRHISLVMQTLHKWLSLIVGLQLLIWIVTGLAFNLIDEQFLDANQYRIAAKAQSFNSPLAPTAKLLQQYQAEGIIELKLTSVLSRAVYALTTTQQNRWFWADSLEPLSLSDAEIQAIAKESYSGSGVIGSAQILTHQTPFDASGPIAELTAADEVGTRIYIDTASGAVLAHQNRHSDLKDLLFMLHFMDYAPDNGIGFNHLLVQVVSIATLLLGLSGIYILGHKFHQSQLSLPFFRRKAATGKLALYTQDNQPLAKFTELNGTYLESINRGSERLRTQCGGGGRCGLCKLRFVEQPPSPNDYDLDKLTIAELEQGIRLGCQHEAHPGKLELATKAQHRYWSQSER